MKLSFVNHALIEAARVGFHAAFIESMLASDEPDPLEILFTEVPSTTALEEWNWFGDLPGMEEWKGDRKLATFGAFKLQVANKDWSNGIKLHQNDIKDDKLGLVAPQIHDLARKARRHRADLCVKALINGFDGTPYPDVGTGLTYDGAFLFSDVHSSEGGPNQSNKMTTALSPAAVETAELKLKGFTTYDGKDPCDMAGTHLIVGPKLEAIATKICQSEVVPSAAGTASETNIHRGRYKPLVSRRLVGDYDDWWFLADLSHAIRPMLFQLREDISTSAIVGGQGTQNDSLPRFKAGELWFGAEARYNVSPFEWRCIVGSKVA
jgi:phage major head subunit gpT-like protein